MVRRLVALGTGFLALVSPMANRWAQAQSPNMGQVSSPRPGTSGSAGLPGTSPGQQSPIYGGPAGASPGRYQPRLTSPPAINFGPAGAGSVALPPALPGRAVELPKQARPGAVEPPEENLAVGKPGGMTLDEAIDRLLHNNLDLRTQFSEIPQAEADVLTASLRANPILYTDSQFIPYGSYSPSSSGGPTQYDLNVVYPLDLSHKRQARTRVAVLAKRAVEAAYKDAVRLSIDNLYTAYVDALVAQDNVAGLAPPQAGGFRDLRSTITVDEPYSALRNTQRVLAVMLNMPLEEVATRELYGRYNYRSKEEPALPSEPELIRIALDNRPDILAQRLTVAVAEADVKAVMANRFEDVLLLYQPYTYTNGGPFHLKNTLSWTLGVTVPLPIYNRQQGNLQKARLIADQARTKLASVEQAIIADVQGAVLEHETAHQVVKRTYQDFVDAVGMKPKIKVSAELANDPSVRRMVEVLEKLKDDAYDDKGRQLREAIVRHRRSMLRLNTALSLRLMP